MTRSRKNKKLSLFQITVIILIIFSALLYLDYLSKKRIKPPEIKKPLVPLTVPTPVLKQKVAIIIDDMGYNKEVFYEIEKLNIKLTLSFLPDGAYAKILAAEAKSCGFDVMLHLPMEPISFPKENPGKEAIFVKMKEDEIKKLVEKHLNSVPFIVGVNNHMGSRATENKNIMFIVLNEIKKKNLLFIDSLTTQKSICETVAKEIEFKIFKRDIFLDSEQTFEFTKDALKRLVNLAKRKKKVIAIGHPNKSTISALKEEIPNMLNEGVEFVTISQLEK